MITATAIEGSQEHPGARREVEVLLATPVPGFYLCRDLTAGTLHTFARARLSDLRETPPVQTPGAEANAS